MRYRPLSRGEYHRRARRAGREAARDAARAGDEQLSPADAWGEALADDPELFEQTEASSAGAVGLAYSMFCSALRREAARLDVTASGE